jgi:hypothetical protein
MILMEAAKAAIPAATAVITVKDLVKLSMTRLAVNAAVIAMTTLKTLSKAVNAFHRMYRMGYTPFTKRTNVASSPAPTRFAITASHTNWLLGF